MVNMVETFLQSHHKMVIHALAKGVFPGQQSLWFVRHPENSCGTTVMPCRNFSPVQKHRCNGNPHLLFSFLVFSPNIAHLHKVNFIQKE